MPAITGFRAESESGAAVAADPHGNNVAFLCLSCGAPVLAVLHVNQRGSSEQRPTSCRNCGSDYWVEPIQSESRLIIRTASSQKAQRFVRGKSPSITAGHNAASWSVIESILQAYGGASYEDLCAAVSQHGHGSGKGFVDYCISNGWLNSEGHNSGSART